MINYDLASSTCATDTECSSCMWLISPVILPFDETIFPAQLQLIWTPKRFTQKAFLSLAIHIDEWLVISTVFK